MWGQIIQDVRALVLPSFEAAFPDVKIYLDNEQVNTGKLPATWVEAEVRFYDGQQIGVAASPKTRVPGYFYATVFMREGTGVMKGLACLQHLAGLLGYANVGACRFQAPAISDAERTGVRGWEARELKVPFYADQS